jgi:50S ribosomal subunit-associated GTPase HflX
LAQKPQIVVANKMDIAGAETTFRALKERLKTDIIGISAKDGTGIDKLLKKLAEVLEG